MLSRLIARWLLGAVLVVIGVPGLVAQDFEPGVGIRVYSVEGGMLSVPNLAPNQTPNYEQVFENVRIDGRPPWAEAVPGKKLIQITAELTCPDDAPGKYDVRLRGGGALWLKIWGGIRPETTLDKPGDVVSKVILETNKYAKIWIRQLTVDGADASLVFEWKAPGADAFVPVPAGMWRTIADPTRVTSPGIKRVRNTRRPGDGNPVAGVHPSYSVSTIRPAESKPSVGAMAFLPDGRLIVGTFNPLQRNNVALPDIDSKEPDKLYEVKGALGDDPAAYALVPVAEGLYEPSGLCAVGDALYVSHRRAVTRLLDKDGDGFFEDKHDVGSGWEGWNYHQFTFGLEHVDGKLYAALSTAMAPPAWEGMDSNATVNGPMRGTMLEIDLATETTKVVAGGLRTPNTVALGPGGDLFYADNQGTWFPTSVLSHVRQGRFQGHFNRTNLVPKLAERFPNGGYPSAYSDQLRSHPAVYLPQNEMINSPTKALMIHEGPYAGQMLIGEITSGGIRRVCLEKVNGHWQGAVLRFTQGLECGVNRLAWGPDGALYIGGIGGGGGWAWNGTRFGLQRMVYNGKPAFEIHRVMATPDGFYLRFTDAVEPAWLNNPANYALEQWTYEPSKEYGGVKVDNESLSAAAAQADADGKGVTIKVPGLKAEHCVYIRTDPESVKGEKLWSTEAYYTLIHQPKHEPVQASILNGQPLIAADDAQVSLGLRVLPPANGTALIARSYRGAMHYSKKEPKGLPNKGGVTSDELIAMDEIQGVPVSAELGSLVTKTVMGDQRLHLEWLAPGTADGSYTQRTGNSGVYIQGRYEVQVLGTPAGKQPLEAYEAGSIYKFKVPDVNASRGPGQWQAYDIWFRAARFDEDGKKTEDARMTVYWNGKLVHNDVAVTPTGSMAKHGEPIEAGQTMLLGPLRLQGHSSDAAGPVRFRNVWIAPIDEAAYAAEPQVDLFNGQDFAGWTVCGGKSEFSVEDGEVVGVAVPSTSNTFLVTEKAYADFELTYDIKTPKPLNSGVQIRSHVDGGVDNRTGRIRGYQVEGDPKDRRYSGGIFDEARRGWIAPLIEKPYARQAWRDGEWNTITVVAQGTMICTWVNGIPAASVMDAMTLAGHIGLQIHGVGKLDTRPEVRFRNIKLRELRPVD